MELKFTMKYIEKIIKSKNIKQFNLIFYNLIKYFNLFLIFFYFSNNEKRNSVNMLKMDKDVHFNINAILPTQPKNSKITTHQHCNNP